VRMVMKKPVRYLRSIERYRRKIKEKQL
jgi:hypothetical protein